MTELKDFEEMFNLTPKEESKEVDADNMAEEYAYSSENNGSFEELVGEVKNNIKEVSDKGAVLEKKVEDPHDIIRDVSSKTYVQKEVIKKQENIIKEEVTEMFNEEDFDSLPEQKPLGQNIVGAMEESAEIIKDDIFTVKEEAEETDKEDDKEEDDKELEEKENNLDNVGSDDSSMINGEGSVSWYLNSPSLLYNPFYIQKKRVLDSCLPGGQIQFASWSKELEEAQVDVITEVFDQQIIIKQMELVQKFRNRVKYIGVRTNNQYFLFDRFVPLLRGFLARITYIKPSIKQDGLILEHMGDIELYLEKLRGLHKSVVDTEKNLAAAYEMLSRKVTICMGLPPAERYNAPDKQTTTFNSYIEKEDSDSMKDFDDLPDNAKAGEGEKTSGVVGWDSL